MPRVPGSISSGLGVLISLDLPWNPTVLEQRKGRVQRGTVAKRIPFYNMRYDKGVGKRCFRPSQVVSRRLLLSLVPSLIYR